MLLQINEIKHLRSILTKILDRYVTQYIKEYVDSIPKINHTGMRLNWMELNPLEFAKIWISQIRNDKSTWSDQLTNKSAELLDEKCGFSKLDSQRDSLIGSLYDNLSITKNELDIVIDKMIDSCSFAECTPQHLIKTFTSMCVANLKDPNETIEVDVVVVFEKPEPPKKCKTKTKTKTKTKRRKRRKLKTKVRSKSVLLQTLKTVKTEHLLRRQNMIYRANKNNPHANIDSILSGSLKTIKDVIPEATEINLRPWSITFTTSTGVIKYELQRRGKGTIKNIVS
jgi:hypothetical protein